MRGNVCEGVGKVCYLALWSVCLTHLSKRPRKKTRMSPKKQNKLTATLVWYCRNLFVP